MLAAMTADERSQHEARADRAVKRGEMAEALEALRRLRAAFPDDARYAERLQEIETSVAPGELTRPRPNDAATTRQAEAEALLSEGDPVGALNLYRQLVAEQSGNELFRERLAEIFDLVSARRPSGRPGAGAPREARAAALEELLGRVLRRRRSPAS